MFRRCPERPTYLNVSRPGEDRIIIVTSETLPAQARHARTPSEN